MSGRGELFVKTDMYYENAHHSLILKRFLRGIFMVWM
jgi:hypothetical protein